MLQMPSIISGNPIKYSIIGFILLAVAMVGYRVGHYVGYTPKHKMCADEISGLVQEREKFITCDVERQRLKLKGISDCTFDKCQPMCVGSAQKAVEDYIALEKEILCP